MNDYKASLLASGCTVGESVERLYWRVRRRLRLPLRDVMVGITFWEKDRLNPHWKRAPFLCQSVRDLSVSFGREAYKRRHWPV